MIQEMEEARQNGFSITILQVTCTLAECLKRNRQRERTVPDEIVISIWNEVEEVAPKLLPHADKHLLVDTSQ